MAATAAPRVTGSGKAADEPPGSLVVRPIRGIESADASLYATVMTYDDALVTLIAEVASTYVNIRGLDEQIRLARENVAVQQEAGAAAGDVDAWCGGEEGCGVGVTGRAQYVGGRAALHDAAEIEDDYLVTE